MMSEYSIDKLKIPRHLDRRVKLTDDDKKLIKILYSDGMGIRQISRKFEKKCSRRMIQFVLFPERLEKVKERAKEVKRWDKHNAKEYRTPSMREHRAYKRSIKDELITAKEESE